MASSTRSGRILKHEGTSTTRSGNAAVKVKNIKVSPTFGSAATGTKNRVNNSTAKATNSSSLRTSSNEMPAKKTTASSPSPRKSEKLENQAPSTPPDKKKRSRSPLRRSERIEKNGISCSPGSKKLTKSSNPLLKKKKLDDDKNGKIEVTSTENQNKDKKLDVKRSGILKKKTRLAARRYRALLQPKKDECPDDDDDNDSSIKDASASKGNSSNSVSSNSKKDNEVLNESNGRKGDTTCRKYSVDNSKEPAEGSSSGSRELAELTPGSGLRKSSRLSGKKKIEDKLPVSKCRGGSTQSSLVGLTTKDNGDCVSQREIHGANKHDADKLDVEELEASGLVASTSEGNSLAVDTGPQCGVTFEGSKNAKTASDHDFDVSVTTGNIDICNPEISKADVTSSSSFETTSKDIKRCTFCNKFERAHNVLEAHELCLCNAPREDYLIPYVIEEPCEIVSNPCEREAPAACSQGHNVKGNLMPEAREHPPGYEKEKCLVTSPSKENVSISMNVDRGTFVVTDETHTPEEHLRGTHLNDSAVAVQTDSGISACAVCKHPGQLLCCNGKACKRSYHFSCLSPPLLDIPPGVWLCHFCVKKKVELGVYSVSDIIESIWDVKQGMQNGKHYFVKYKGLAHVHNRWVPESQILLKAPMLVAKFDRRHQKEKATRWKQEWTEPHRLLQKRQLMPKNLADEYFLKHGDKFSYCYHEWLVKWKGLGYEYATWELENSPFLCSSDARALIHDFESRHEAAKRLSDPLRADKALQVKKSSFHKLARLLDDCPAGLDNDHLNSVNRLREFWHKSQNAVFIDDQERIIKSVLFISSLTSHICQPILIISTIHSVLLWETQFIRLAPSINVVVYTGTNDIRKLIRTLEFYEEGGRVMFQVLLSHPDAVIEDFNALDCISWEALIIDECQNPRVSKHLEQFKNLSTEFRLLLLSGQLKDKNVEYINLLSFLESGGNENGSRSSKYATNDTVDVLAILKEKLKRYLAYERKPVSSKFLEYWVPVRLSNVQLEQYCSTLLSNLITLRSSSKIDHVGALRDILISTRKCCDHPYLLGGSLQSSLIKDLPLDKYLDIGVEASGKLHLLDKFLHEIKNQGLRVLILFQSIGGAGRDSIGDILDDFLRQRFGDESYERVDNGLIMSKKLPALNKFNDKANGRFVFLIENRACLPSIKLSSVDAVVIFNSDWNPLNDLRALQKIHIESQFEHVKVFRLYSSCTVEEKVLIFAKQDMILDSNIQNISPSNSHLLLSWGAFHLFNQLDEFHQHYNVHDYSENSIAKCFLNDSMLKFLNDVIVELVKQLPGKAENDSCQYLHLIKAQQSGASYSRNISLVGERDEISALDKDPPSFWSNLLEKRCPKWRFISEPSQRIRRKVQNFEESLKVPEVENNEVRKKRRKLTTNTVDPISLQTWLQDKTKGMGKDAKVSNDISPCSFNQPASISPTTTPTFPSNLPMEPETYASQSNVGTKYMPSSAGSDHVTCNLQASSLPADAAEIQKFPTGESEGRRNAQRALHFCLKPELSELCNILKLPDDVKDLVHMLLEYIMNNHHVNRDPETILQAFKLSLCWRAASFLKHKVDHKECLALAKKYLNYTCSEEQADSVYLKLRMLKKKFSQTGALRHEDEPNSLEKQSSASTRADGPQQIHGGISDSASSYLQESGRIKEVSDGYRSSGLLVLEQEQAPVGQSPTKIQQNLDSLKDVLVMKRVDLIDIICSKREDALLLKQQVELSDFNVHREEEKMRLKSAHDALLELIRSIHTNYTIRNEKIKLLNQNFSKKMADFDQHMKCQRRELTVMQEDAKKKERNIRNRWLEEAKAGTLAEAFETLPLTESGFRLEEFNEITEQVEACDGSRSIMPFSRPAYSDIIAKFPGVSTGITENYLEVQSTFSNGRVEDGQATASRSCNVAEVEPLQPIGTSAEILVTVLPNMVEVESNEPNEASVEIPGLISNLMCNDMVTTVPGMSNGTTENNLDMSSNFPNGKVEVVQSLASHSSNMSGVEPIQPNGTFAEIPETVLPNMAEVESIEPNETSAEIPATSLAAGDDDISKDSGTPFSESEVMNVLGKQPDAIHMVPIETSGQTAEIPETVLLNTFVLESIEPNETSKEIPAPILPVGDGDITKEGETPFSAADGMNILCNQIEPNETSTETPTILPSCVGDITRDDGTPFSESDLMNVLGNQPQTMHMVPLVATPSLPHETETPAFQSNNMVELESVEPNRTSAGVPATISCAEEGDISRVTESPLSQMNNTGNGPDEILTDSTLATTDAIMDMDMHEAEDNVDDTYLRSSPLQNPSELPSTSHASTSCCENSVLPNLVLSVSEHDTLAVASGTEREEGFSSPQAASPPVCCSTAQTEVPVQQRFVTASMLADQSNQLVSQSANLLSERTRTEDIGSTGVPQEPGSRLLEILPMAVWMHPQGLHPDPLQNERMRIQTQVELRTKMHEDKKLQLKLECEQEIEKVRKKYDALIQDDEAGFHQDKKILETIYSKVLANQILAEEFRTKFIDTKAGTSASSQGHSSSSTQQFLQASHAEHARRPSSTSGSVHVPILANLPPIAMPARASTTLPLAGSGAQVPASSSVTPGLVIRHTPSVIPANHVRSQFSHMLAPRPNLQGGTDIRAPAPRAPAPHLHSFRPNTSMMPLIHSPRPSQMSSQQHPRTNLDTAAVAAGTPPIYPPRAPLSRTYPPVASGQLPLSRGTFLPSVELPRDLGAANVAADLPHLSQLEVGTSIQGWLPPELPVNSSEMATSTVVATRPTTSAAPVVCLSDDDE